MRCLSLDESTSTTGPEVIDLDQSHDDPSVATRRRRTSSSSSQDIQAFPQPITSSNKRKKTRSNDLEDEQEDLSRTTVQNDAEVCSICFEEWTNSGHHRLVATDCGHLFGKRSRLSNPSSIISRFSVV